MNVGKKVQSCTVGDKSSLQLMESHQKLFLHDPFKLGITECTVCVNDRKRGNKLLFSAYHIINLASDPDREFNTGWLMPQI